MSAEATPQQLWAPSAAFNKQTVFARYLSWLERERGLRFSGYADTWHWSTNAIEDFWASLWDFFQIKAARRYDAVLSQRQMPGARWFPGAELNYAEHVFRMGANDRPALLFAAESRPLQTISWHELRYRVASVADSLRELGVRRGDRVAGFLPNTPDAVVALLACASIGAIWSCCSPDFGAQAVIERFKQIEPRVLIAVDGYRYGGKALDRRAVVVEVSQALPSLTHTVLIPYLDREARVRGSLNWESLQGRNAPLTFEPVPFEHPLWILYSSGTTGLPKCIVQGHGGIVLEHLKAHVLQNDMKPGDRFFWFTTTGWMMWNLLLGGLLAGCTCVLYDGSPSYPNLGALWLLAQDARITRFGASAGYFHTCMKEHMRPAQRSDLSALRAVGSTGSPLSPEAFRWIYDSVKHDVWLASTSGGTDVCSSFLGACPFLPVYEGEFQGPTLGTSLRAFDEQGRAVVDQVGELVITQPMPSMPLYFWNDPDDLRYRETYFEMYPGVWRHGDWVRLRSGGGAVIYGRSDSTLNRLGVRIGTSEIYSAVESLPEVTDSLVVGVERPNGEYYMPLFVVLQERLTLDEPLRERIRQTIRNAFSPRHVPDAIIQVQAIPRTLNGKKMEVPVKRILQGATLETAAHTGSLSNPQSLQPFVELAMTLNDVRIRDARPEEQEQIRKLTEAAYAEYQKIMAPAAWAALAGAVTSGLATTESVQRIVAQRGQVVVGSVQLYAASADAYQGLTPQSGCPEVRLLAVAPGARGQGIARALMDECVRRARQSGARELGLHTSASMSAAIKLYEDMGFVRAPAHDFQPEGAERVTAYRLALADS